MKTMNIDISDKEFQKFGLKEKLSFSEFLHIIITKLSTSHLSKSISAAEKYGLSEISMEEINKEVEALRADAKSNS